MISVDVHMLLHTLHVSLHNCVACAMHTYNVMYVQWILIVGCFMCLQYYPTLELSLLHQGIALG